MKEASCSIVIPVFNESQRLLLSDFETALREQSGLQLVFVDDGSSDASACLLSDFVRAFPQRTHLLQNKENLGKGESVRRGLLESLERGAEFLGYWDADLATSLSELPRFASLLEQDSETLAVYGSRLKLLGREVERSWVRHYVGRIYATLISMTLKLGVYDSQCGAKLFRASPAIRNVLDRPFLTRWLFDVEILARLIVAARAEPTLHPDRSVKELPLLRWVDVPGSKVKPWDALRAIPQLLRIRASMRP